MAIIDMTAVEIVEGIADRELTAREVAEALAARALERADLNSLLDFDADAFVARAAAADAATASGVPGPLHGLPMVIKDNIDVSGYPTTAATPALRANRPERDGPVMRALLDAGAIVMAKANMHELAFSPAISTPEDGSATVYGAFGNARNPYDPTRSPAGSSSGTAAALAARIAPAGLGSDTGGSVRNPAAWCGIAGFRPAMGRYSPAGVVPVCPTRDTIGPMARTVADIALLDAAVTGETETPGIVWPELRLGLDREFFVEGAEPDIAALFETELARLADAGAQIVEIRIEGLQELLDESGRNIAMYEMFRALPQYLKEVGGVVTLDDVFDQAAASGLGRNLRAARDETPVSDETYEDALKRLRPALQKLYADAFKDNGLDALVLPSCLVTAQVLHDPPPHPYKGGTLSPFMAAGHNVAPGSSIGTPGLTVPMGLTGDGLPAAIGFDGPMGSDRKLLAIGAAYEALRPPIPAPAP